MPLFSKKSAPKRRGHELVSDPGLDWLIILAVSSLAALALVALGVYVYLGASSRLSQVGLSAAARKPKFDDAALDQALGDFQLRSAVTESRASSYPIPSDPSLP